MSPDAARRQRSMQLARFPLYRLVALCAHACVVVGFSRLDVEASSAPVITQLKPYKFLTISGWCFGFQTMHLVLSFAVEWQHWCGVCGNNKFLESITNMKDSLYRGIVFPVTTQMCTLFWLVHWLDRELVYPRAWDAVVPAWLHVAVHVGAPAAAAAESVTRRAEPAPAQCGREAALYWLLSAGYALLLDAVYLHSNTWIYPFLGWFSWWQLLLFQLGFCLFGRALLQLVWTVDRAPTSYYKVE